MIRRSFTLLELLVVLAVIMLLIAILLPALGAAREQGRRAVCASNLRQILIGIRIYADNQDGLIPRSRDPEHPFDFAASHIATNQLWVGSSASPPSAEQSDHYTGLGRLLADKTTTAELFFCPADDNLNLLDERPKIGTDQDAYGSYLYRQLDHLPEAKRTGRLDDLGANRIGGEVVRVQALALDANSLGPGDFYHTNHAARVANLLFRDGAVVTSANLDNAFAIPAEAFSGPMDILLAIDQILTNADYAYKGDPASAPRVAAALEQ